MEYQKEDKPRVVRIVTKVKGRPYFFCPQSLIVYLPGTFCKLFLSNLVMMTKK